MSEPWSQKVLTFFPKLPLSKVGSTLQKDHIIWSTFEYALYYRREEYFQIVYSDINEVLSSGKCSRIKEKMAEICNFRNVDAFLSELTFAKKLIERGCSIDFILDNDPRFKGKSPDFFATDGKQTAWIEVRRAGEMDRLSDVVIENLRSLCKKLKPPFVRISYSIIYFYEEIFNNIDILLERTMKSTQEFEEIAKKNDYHLKPGDYNCGNLVYQVVNHEGQHSIPFSGGPHEVFKIEIEPFEKSVSKLIDEKSTKSKAWDGKICYYFAIDFQHAFNEIDELVTVLYGKTTHYIGDWSNIPGWKFDDSLFPETIQALERGWDRNFFLSTKLIPNNIIRIENKGLFLTNSNSKELSGILSLFRLNKKGLFITPNPFTKPERENLNFTWLGDLPPDN